MIRNATLARPLTTLPNANVTRRSPAQQLAVSRQALDVFDTGPTSSTLPPSALNLGNGPTSLANTNPTNSTPSTTSSSGGGFFSNLFSGILGGLKSFASGLLGKATSFLDGNWGSWMGQATSAIGNLFSGFATKAKGWLDGLLSGITNSLGS